MKIYFQKLLHGGYVATACEVYYSFSGTYSHTLVFSEWLYCIERDIEW